MDAAEAIFIAVVAAIVGIFVGGALANAGHGAYELLKDQGSALGGVLALIAGVLAYHAGQKQAQAARNQLDDIRTARKTQAQAWLYRCKVALPLPLIEIHDYTTACLKNLELVLSYGFRGDTEIANNAVNLSVNAVPPQPIQRLTDALLYCSDSDAKRIGFFLQFLQIQNSRLESVRKRIQPLHVEHPVFRYELSTYIRDTLHLVGWQNTFLSWARGAVEIVPPPDDLSRLAEMELTDFPACRAQLANMSIHAESKSSNI